MTWKVVEVEGLGAAPAPERPILCTTYTEEGFCGTPLLLHRFACVRQTGGWKHLDVNLKCPRCGHFYIFGLRVGDEISEEDYERLRRSKLHMRVLRFEVVKLIEQGVYAAEDAEKIKRRLQSLGYW